MEVSNAPQDIKLLEAPADPLHHIATVLTEAPLPDAVIPIPPVVVPEREVAYRISDKYFEPFDIYKSANAWWMNRIKVEGLVKSLKNGYSITESCISISISLAQYKYFCEIHPDFSTIKEACETYQRMLLETGITSHLIKATPSVLMWAGERLKPDKYGKQMAEGLGGPVLNNYGTIVNTPVDASTAKQSVVERILLRKQAEAIGNSEDVPVAPLPVNEVPNGDQPTNPVN